MAVAEAPFRETTFGLVADVDGWFVLNARDSRWRDHSPLEVACDFEGKRRFRQLGFNITVLEPGRSLGLYHRERHQEGFLVHCPGATAHVIVGAGDGPAVVVAIGASGGREGLVYEVDATALEFRAGVERATTEPRDAYARFPQAVRAQYREGWLRDL